MAKSLGQSGAWVIAVVCSSLIFTVLMTLVLAIKPQEMTLESLPTADEDILDSKDGQTELQLPTSDKDQVAKPEKDEK